MGNYSLDAAASSTSTVQHGAQHQKSKGKYTTTAQTLRQTAKRCLQMHNLRQRYLQEKNPRQTIGDKVNNMQLQFGRSRFVHKYGATRHTTPKIKTKIHYFSNFATNCKKVSANAQPTSTAFARKIPDKLSGTK